MSIKYSRLTREQVPLIVKLLMSYGITFVGLSSFKFLSQVMDDAVIAGNPIVTIATTMSGDIVGWSIAIRNSRHYWKKFIILHPFYVAKIFMVRIFKMLISANNFISDSSCSINKYNILWKNKSCIVWGESNPNVARHIDITVLEGFRQRGIGARLYSEQFKSIKSESVERIDASICSYNIASQYFHIKNGWDFVKIKNNCIYITKNITEDKL